MENVVGIKCSYEEIGKKKIKKKLEEEYNTAENTLTRTQTMKLLQ